MNIRAATEIAKLGGWSILGIVVFVVCVAIIVGLFTIPSFVIGWAIVTAVQLFEGGNVVSLAYLHYVAIGIVVSVLVNLFVYIIRLICR